MNPRHSILAAGLFGATGVALGAFGAHALSAFLAEHNMAPVWDTAVRYQLFQSAALLGAAAWQRSATGAAASRAGWAARCWSSGIVLFSGSLYGLAAGGPRWIGAITPIGGVALITGWVCVIAAAIAKEE